MPSIHEEEIRERVVQKLRDQCPKARIVHELNVAGTGSNRIDVAAIGTNYIVAVEIKSKRDTLSRLTDQIAAFGGVADRLIVAAHRKHFIEHRAKWQSSGSVPTLKLNHPFHTWATARQIWLFTEEENPLQIEGSRGTAWPVWLRHGPEPIPMHPDKILGMLWRSELYEECGRNRISATTRSNRSAMIYDMAMNLTNLEVKAAVCRQLRARVMARADAPVM